MNENLFFFALIAILPITLVYLTGKLIVSFFKPTENRLFNLFVILITGVVSLIFVFALFKSGGRTINLVLIPTAAMLLFTLKDFIRKPALNLRIILSEWMLTLVAFTPVFFYQSYFYFNLSEGGYEFLHFNHYLYAGFSDALSMYGTETRFAECVYFYPEFKNVLLQYHYAELWLTSFFRNVFLLPSMASYFLVSIPVLAATYVIGVASLFQSFIKNDYLKVLPALLLLFVCGLYFDFYKSNELTGHSSLYTNNGIISVIYQKTAFIYVFLLLAFVLLFRGQKLLSGVIFAVIPVFSIAFLPAVYGGLFLYTAWLYTSNKFRLSKHELLPPTLAVINLILIFVFYYIFRSEFLSGQLGGSFLSKLLAGEAVLSDYKIFAGNMIHRFVRLIIFYWPYLLIIAFIARKVSKSLRELWIFAFFATSAGIITSCFMYDLYNSYQFGSNSFIIVNILIIITFISFANNSKVSNLTKSLVLGVFLTLFLFEAVGSFIEKNSYRERTYDKTFVNSVKEQLSGEQNLVLVFLNEDDYKRMHLYESWSMNNNLLPLMQYTTKNIIFTLGNPEVYFKVKNVTHQEEFNNYSINPLQLWRARHRGDVNTFISEHKINYIYAKPDVVLPEIIYEKQKLLIKSEMFGEMFYVLE